MKEAEFFPVSFFLVMYAIIDLYFFSGMIMVK